MGFLSCHCWLDWCTFTTKEIWWISKFFKGFCILGRTM